MAWSGRETGKPGFRVICGAEVRRPAKDRPSAIPNAGIVVQVQPAGRHRNLNLSADERNRNKLAAKLNHFRTAGSRLEPLAMMVGGIPPIDGCVIAAEGYFEGIALIVTDDGTLNFGIEARCASQSGIA